MKQSQIQANKARIENLSQSLEVREIKQKWVDEGFWKSFNFQNRTKYKTNMHQHIFRHFYTLSFIIICAANTVKFKPYHLLFNTSLCVSYSSTDTLNKKHNETTLYKAVLHAIHVNHRGTKPHLSHTKTHTHARTHTHTQPHTYQCWKMTTRRKSLLHFDTFTAVTVNLNRPSPIVCQYKVLSEYDACTCACVCVCVKGYIMDRKRVETNLIICKNWLIFFNLFFFLS